MNFYFFIFKQNCPEAIYDLMLQCWNKEDKTRLHMAEIHDKLEMWISCSPDFLKRHYNVDDKK